ncbi:MAG: membrane protein insertase YidC [bacterium]
MTIAVCAAILISYQYLILPILVPPAPKRASIQPPPAKTPASRPGKPPVSQTSAPSGKALQAPVKKREIPAKDIKIENDLYEIVISNKGGVIKSWKLKRYDDADGHDLQLVSLPSVTNNYFPLRLDFTNDGLNKRVKAGLFEFDNSEISLDRSHSTGRLTLTYVDEASLLKIEKILTFSFDSYSVKIEIQIYNSSNETRNVDYYLNWGYNLGRELKPGDHTYAYVGPESMVNGELNKDELGDIEGKLKIYDGSVSWAALQDNYFAAILVPKSMSSKVQVIKSGDSLGAIGVASAKTALNPQQETRDEFVLYGGPKLEKQLKKLNCNAAGIIDYGWFGTLARPTIAFLNYINKFCGNYGISIIVLTILIKIVFLPLTQGSFKSMKKMQELQPKIAAIKAKYKKDSQKVNEETMALYRKHKVNPLGGCMPMVLQIPVFFALYKGLLVAIELRHSPFIPAVPFTDIPWLYDLSLKDPYYITSVLMGITMFFQQKMTPTTAEGGQAKMMMLMPVIFTFMFLNFPSGLVIYWLVNNILTIAQQALINKSDD